jgi:hypothetical protein
VLAALLLLGDAKKQPPIPIAAEMMIAQASRTGVVRSGHPLVSSTMTDIKAFFSNQRGYKLSLRQDGFRDSGLIPADFLPKVTTLGSQAYISLE